MHKVKAIVLGIVFLCTLVFVPQAKAQANSYKQTNLTNTQGSAIFRGADLVNHWGLAPMSVVANTGSGFKVAGTSSEFILATEDGTISIGNARNRSTMLAVNNSGMGAVYKGLALVTESDGNQMLLAANFNAGVVEAFDSTFAPMTLRGTFRDPALPAGFAPFGIHVVGDNEVVVTFAQQDASRHDVVRTAGAGFVSMFDFQGNFIHRIASQGTLNAPFGAAIAPASFGHFAGALLIGNFGDGTINAFDMRSATFLGQLKNVNGSAIINPSLRELAFDTAGQGSNSHALFITASLGNAQHGLFAEITPDATTGATFSLSASPSTLTVARGSTGTLTITATAMTGFSGTIGTLTCTGLPTNTNYTFSKTTLMPSGTTTDSTTLTVQTSKPSGGGYGGVGVAGMILWLPLASMGMFGMIVVDPRRRKKLNRRTLWRWLGLTCGVALLFGSLLSVSGCGGGSGGTPTTSGATVTVTGTSGTEMESTTFSLTVQ